MRFRTAGKTGLNRPHRAESSIPGRTTFAGRVTAMPKVCEDQTESPLETLSCSPFGDLSIAERKIVRAAPRGDFAWCSPSHDDNDSANDPANGEAWEEQRAIRAKLIRWLCIDKEVRPHIDPRGIRIHGARITGALDLENGEVPFPLHLRRCFLEEGMNLSFAQIRSLDLEGSRTGPIIGPGCVVQGSVFLWKKFRAKGQVRLPGAKISRVLVCVGGAFENPGGDALIADEINVGGSVFLNDGFVADGAVRLVGAQIGGVLNCEAGRFHNAEKTALLADGVRVASTVMLRNGFTAAGCVSLLRAEIGGDLDCLGGTFRNPGKPALTADGAKVTGYVFLQRLKGDEAGEQKDFSAEGEVRLERARIGADLDCKGGIFSNRNGPALNADGAKIEGSIYLGHGFHATGEVKMRLTVVGGDFECTGGRFDNRNGTALKANEIKVAGSIRLNNRFAAFGEVCIPGATVGANLECDGGLFINQRPSGAALFAPGIHVGGRVSLSKHAVSDDSFIVFTALGSVRLVRAEIGSDLKLEHAKLRNFDRQALAADGIKIGRNVLLSTASVLSVRFVFREPRSEEIWSAMVQRCFIPPETPCGDKE
jgi:hypothetical protein